MDTRRRSYGPQRTGQSKSWSTSAYCPAEATLAEVDRLGRRVCNVAGDARVHAVRIHDMGPGSESIVNQVVVYAQAPSADAETIRSICEEWAIDCANERTIEPLAM